MSFFAGCDFFMVLFILLIPAVLLGLSEKKLKWYRWLLSLFFIWEVYGSTKIQLLYLIGYVIFAAYLVKIYLYLRKKYGRNKYIYGHAVFLSLRMAENAHALIDTLSKAMWIHRRGYRAVPNQGQPHPDEIVLLLLLRKIEKSEGLDL